MFLECGKHLPHSNFGIPAPLPVAAEGAVIEVTAGLLERDEVGEESVVGLLVVGRPHALGLDLTPTQSLSFEIDREGRYVPRCSNALGLFPFIDCQCRTGK